MKPLLVGQAPARSGDGRPFTGASGRRLCQLLDVPDYDALVHLLDMTNLLPEIQPKVQGKKGDSFDRALARRAAIRLRTHIVTEERRAVVLAGGGVARAFGIAHPTPFKRYNLGDHANYYVIPHPSGINLFWNDPTNVDRASRFLRAIVFDWPTDHPSIGNPSRETHP